MTAVVLRRRSGGPGVVVGAAVAAAGCVVVGHSMTSPALSRGAVGLSVALALVAMATLAPRLALYGLVTWLAVLGLVRRLLTSLGSTADTLGDPLLLVGPVLLVVLFAVAVERGAMRDSTPLSKSVLALTAVLALSALNPLQGGISVGLGGALLVVVPMLAFWVGRSLLDEYSVGVLIRLLAGLAVFAAIYGLMQTFYGMPHWDQAWITDEGYAALNVGGTIRAFGMSSSASEYAALLGVGILAWRAIAHSPLRLLVAVTALALLVVALWLTSGRGIVVLTLAALWLTFAAARQMRMRRALAAGALLLLLLPTAVSYLMSSPQGSGHIESLTTHQVEGLSDPFGDNSTLGAHFGLVVDGITQTVVNPLGRGVGAITNAASKFGGTEAGTEADPGNAPVAAGFIGLVLYLLVAGYGLTCCYRLARSRRTMPAIAALGIVVVTFLQWLTGGQYAIIVLAWLLLGWVDSQERVATNPGRRQRSWRHEVTT